MAGRAERGQAARGVAPGRERREMHHGAQVVEVGLQTGDAGVIQRPGQLGQRLRTVIAMRDQLGQHRVVMGADLAAARNPGVDPDVARKTHLGQQAGGRLKILRRVFGVQARLHRVAACHHLQGVEVGHVTGGQAHHPVHQIDAGHRFGDTMLHLQAGVDFQKEKLLGACVHNKFHRAGRAVTGFAGQLARRVQQRLAHLGAQIGRWGFFHHLLVAPLQRTVALTQRQHVARAVAKNLHLDVARIADEALQKNTGIGKIGLRQPFHRLKGTAQGLGVRAHLHANATPTGAALEHHRVANEVGVCQRRVQVGQQAGAGQQGHTSF